jgi:glycosyltransferase involved in cell wall biosynthesis
LTVSVIIPNYNHSKYLKQRIESILNQTYRDFELIILDDYSTDDSRAIINQYITDYPEIIGCFNEVTSGSPFVQWNSGVKMARGEFIWIAESDDSASPDFLEKTVPVLKKILSAGLVFSDSKIINEQNGREYLASERRSAPSYKSTFSKSTIRAFLENPIVNVSSVLFRKDVFLEAGGADSAMKYCGDWLIYIKILRKAEIKYIQEPLNTFRLHSGSTFHSKYRDNSFIKEKLKIYSYILKNFSTSPLIILLMIKNTGKALILRLIYYLNIDTLLKIELPRQPHLA